jgi:hypothetical protein
VEWKAFLDKNWSRKAEIVFLTQLTVVLLVRIPEVEAGVLEMALVISGIIGLAGLVIQGVLDWKHPKPPPGVVTTRRNGPLSITEANVGIAGMGMPDNNATGQPAQELRKEQS